MFDFTSITTQFKVLPGCSSSGVDRGVATDPCDAHSCLRRGGRCRPVNQTDYVCVCRRGFSGPRCDVGLYIIVRALFTACIGGDLGVSGGEIWSENVDSSATNFSLVGAAVGIYPPPFLNPLKILAGPDWLAIFHYSHCGNEVRLTLPVAVCLFSLCSLYTQLLKTRQKTCGDSVDNSVEENSSVFSVIRMRWLPSARACGQ